MTHLRTASVLSRSSTLSRSFPDLASITGLHLGSLPGFASGGIVPGPGRSQLHCPRRGDDTPANQTNNQYWNLTIHSRSPVEPVAQDFAMMRSLAGA